MKIERKAKGKYSEHYDIFLIGGLWFTNSFPRYYQCRFIERKPVLCCNMISGDYVGNIYVREPKKCNERWREENDFIKNKTLFLDPLSQLGYEV